MKNNNETIVWRKSKGNIFETFAVELKEFTRTRKLPDSGEQDMRYALELQEKRLRDKGLIMQYDFVPRGLLPQGGGMYGRSWRDRHYHSVMQYRTCKLIKEFYRGQKKVYNKEQNIIFYQIITDAYNQSDMGEDLYNCPSCGAVSRIHTLRNGCPYCGTFYEMTDLFPKVTNYYFIEDASGTEKEVKHGIKRVIFLCILFSIVPFSIIYYNHPEVGGQLIPSIVRGIFGGALFGTIAGYLLWAIGTIGRLFKKAGESMPMVLNATGSGKRFEKQMQRYSPEFSYQYFSDKVVSILKMIIFSGNAQDLPQYVGEPVGDMFSDIVDASYTGAVALKRFQVQADFCYVTVDVYTENIYDSGKRIYDKKDIFRVDLCRNLHGSVNLNFSVKRIQCKSCGDSFDATKQRNCPNCGTRYEIGDEDWVVLQVKKL